MAGIVYFLRNLFLRFPKEVLVALIRAIILLLFTLFLLILKFIEWILELLKRRDLYPEEGEEPCGKIPEAVVRRPDPCIYSQRLLMSQDLPVTWDNPDIWVAPAANPGATEPDSYHLQDDTEYIVTVRVHNASTDAAIGVRVRLNYRPWSFNSPDLTPVETDGNGDEVVRFVHVPPMGSVPANPGVPPVSPEFAQFRWHTPKLPEGQASAHYCLQASLYHPLDVNTANNMGQENTQVYRTDSAAAAVRPGQTITLAVPLFNLARQAQRFVFAADAYEVNADEKFELQLETNKGHARRNLSQTLGSKLPTLYPKEPSAGRRDEGVRSRFAFEYRPKLLGVKTRYEGFDEIKKTIMSRDYALPEGMIVKVDGLELGAGIEIAGKGQKDVKVTVGIPADAKVGTKLPVNLLAMTENGVLAGGVAVIFNVEEGR